MTQKRNNTRAAALIMLLLSFLVLGITVVPQALYAASCSHSVPPYPHSWYPPTWSYSDSFVSLFGETQQCWSGEQFSHKGHTFGAQYPGVPLSQIRVQVWDWEELWDSSGHRHVQCNDPNSRFADSGWVYGYDAWASTPYRVYKCSGGGGLIHYYVAQSLHYFGGTSNTQWTGAH